MYIGIDLGGTNIAAGLVDDSGKILYTKSTPTLATRGYKAVIDDINKLVKDIIEEAKVEKNEIKAIGIGIPGLADKDGNVIFCVNLGWENIPLRKMMEEELNIPVFIDNDATVAGLAEYEFGSMKGCKNGILLTLGTGIGGGIILNGEVYSGVHGVGSEIGHMIIGENFYNCNCGKNGCFETFASSTAIIKYTQKLISEGNTDTIILQKVEGDLEKINAKVIFDSAKEGDRVAKMAVDRLVKYLVIGIFNIVNFMDPEVIALGGGISNAGEYLLNLVKEEFEKFKYYKTLPAANIVLAQFKNDAGILGAAMLGKHGVR
ncbi:ROK family protein [Thermobrachium celere]|uniref:Glucokinase n=1 Tax=Thermobrachium celere DSM 8682 TaxID=941824 RepID=R7RPQ7_9CLOT|nr:ROK family glucokinase [Thermobrachium celere]GFR34438.1 glucokinase [Thermobrachium celere]CDF57215.1 Glucokinase [Thermobrachium celere DSM 8682]